MGTSGGLIDVICDPLLHYDIYYPWYRYILYFNTIDVLKNPLQDILKIPL
jgi:hypothetical protein